MPIDPSLRPHPELRLGEAVQNETGMAVLRPTLSVLHVLPCLGPGGAERIAMHLVMNMDRKHFSVGVVSLYDRAETDIEATLEASVPVWYLGKRLGVDLRMVARLRRIFREFRPSIVHTHLSVLRYVLPAVAGLRHLRIVHTVHNIAEKEVDRVGKLIHQVAFRCGFVTPVSIAQEVSKSLARVYGLADVPLIPNGIPTAKYAVVPAGCRERVRSEFNILSHELVVLAIGRLTKAKNHRMLIEAIASVCKVFAAPLRCLIAGGGELESELKSQVADLGVEEQVQLLGVRADIPALLAAADIYVMPSEWEGNPLSLMEAMAAGLPVIATKVGGIPDLVEDERSGVLILPGDATELANALKIFATDPALRARLGENAARRAEQRFGVQSMVSAYEEIYVREAAIHNNGVSLESVPRAARQI